MEMIMKLARVVAGVFSAGVFGVLSASAHAQWVNSLKPQGKPAGELRIVEAGKPACVIQSRADATGPEKKAAEDLRYWITQMTGVTLTVALGDTQPESIVIRTDRSLGDQGYRIAIENRRLILSGGHWSSLPSRVNTPHN
jgi:hypothetical protein